MREWTRDERYRVLHDAEEVRDVYEQNRKSVYRQTYHIQPVTGLSSDPNGFAYHNGQWHLFYQWCPWGAVHGLKYWYHVKSSDLVHWENAGVGLKPDTVYDNKGTHSGSAISVDGELYFFYTGNHRDENWVRTPYTCAAVLDENGNPKKLDKPLFGPRDDYSEHQRDPKVFYVPEKKCYYIFIGAQSLDLKGRVVVYKSEKLLSGWSFAGELKVPGYEDFGGMWECPCIERIGDKDVLLFSPQYTTLPGRGNSTNHNVYFIGKMDYDTLTFTPEGKYNYLDYGFDFYAAQLASNVGDPNKAIIISWIGLPDNHYPSAEDEWEGSMIIPRELTIEDGHLLQRPVAEISTLRDKVLYDMDTLESVLTVPKAFEIDVTSDGSDMDLNLFTDENGNGGITFHYDAESKSITADKTGMTLRYNEKVGEVLTMPLRTELKTLRIFVDSCSTEIFVNDGEETFTTHSFPVDSEHNITCKGAKHLTLWTLKAGVKDDFVI